MRLRWPVSRGRISRWLLIASLSLLVIDLSAKALGQVLPSQSNRLHIVQVDSERSIPNWFKSAELAICSVMLFVIYAAKRTAADRFRRGWCGLAIILLLMSVEEVAAGHERLNAALIAAFHPTGPLYYAWVIPGFLVAVLVGLLYLRFILHLPTTVRRRVVLAGFVYVGGAVGLEFLAGWWISSHGMRNLLYAFEPVFEEGMQMIGPIIFLDALMLLARDERLLVELPFDPGA
ncbi:MAG: hypothetical protein ACREJC_09400 [Tepidisphaeraceae bacterium]